MKKIKLIGVFTFLFSAILAFNANVLAHQKPSQKLFGTPWKLVKIEGAPVEASKSFIKFDESKNSIGGNGGCNVFGGSMERKGYQIKFSKVFSTKMFCDGVQETENKFLGNLERVTNYKIKGGKLFLKAGNKILLEFEPKK